MRRPSSRMHALRPGEWWHPDREALIRQYGEDFMNRLNAAHFPLDRGGTAMQDTATGGLPMTQSPLPDVAYCRDLEDRRKIIVLMRGHVGYWDEGTYDTEADAEARVKALNRGFGVTSAQLLAMKVGSRFGWDVPGADPANHVGQHDDEAGDSHRPPTEDEARDMIRAAVDRLNEVSRLVATAGIEFEIDALHVYRTDGSRHYTTSIIKRL